MGRASPGVDIYTKRTSDFCRPIRLLCVWRTAPKPITLLKNLSNAVRAGCIPVYHAHATVKSSFLSGARWIDPADFGFSPRRTIEFALNQDQMEFRSINDAWLESGILADTDDLKVLAEASRDNQWQT